MINQLWSNLITKTMPRVWLINQSKHGCKSSDFSFLIQAFNSHYQTSDLRQVKLLHWHPYSGHELCAPGLHVTFGTISAMPCWHPLLPGFSGQLTAALLRFPHDFITPLSSLWQLLISWFICSIASARLTSTVVHMPATALKFPVLLHLPISLAGSTK